MLRIYRTAPDITTLGPGNRFVIWTQGCRRRCPGCMSPDSRPMDGGRPVSEEALAGTVLRHAFDGVTVSGGEPFLQSAALTKLIRLIRAERDAGVILYTGYTYEELKAFRDPDADALLGEIDLLIDGRKARRAPAADTYRPRRPAYRRAEKQRKLNGKRGSGE